MTTIGSVLLLSLGIFMFIMIIFAIRNEMVYRYRIKAIDITHNKVSTYVKGDGKTLFDWMKFWKKYDSYGTYNEMMFALHKWTFNQFFPDIDE